MLWEHAVPVQIGVDRLKWRCTLIGKEPDLNSGDGIKATAGSSPAISSKQLVTFLLTMV